MNCEAEGLIQQLFKLKKCGNNHIVGQDSDPTNRIKLVNKGLHMFSFSEN